MASVSTLDTMFQQINTFPLTAKVSTVVSGKTLHGVNQLPLISQSIANSVATVAWGISSPQGQYNIQRTIETSVKRRFLPYVNSMARNNKKGLHHLYEWNQVGNTSARLFDLKIPTTSRGKANFSMQTVFRQSKRLVPLTEAQATPGPTGQVVKKVHRFFNKAMVMEFGETVHIRPLGARAMAFDDNSEGRKWGKSFTERGGLIFSRGEVVINYTERPTYHGLSNVVSSYFRTSGGASISTDVRRYFHRVAKSASGASHMINIVMPSDAYAKQIAAQYTPSVGAVNGGL